MTEKQRYREKIRKIVKEKGRTIDIDGLANVLYFKFKQDEESILTEDVNRAFRMIVDVLTTEFGWQHYQVYRCFTKLNSLTQYMKSER